MRFILISATAFMNNYEVILYYLWIYINKYYKWKYFMKYYWGRHEYSSKLVTLIISRKNKLFIHLRDKENISFQLFFFITSSFIKHKSWIIEFRYKLYINENTLLSQWNSQKYQKQIVANLFIERTILIETAGKLPVLH